MMTKYFASATVILDPFIAGSKVARIFLSRIPPSSRHLIKLKTDIVSESPQKQQLIQVEYKDGTVLKFDPSKTTIGDVVEQLDRHSRAMQLKEQMNG
ncbi:hypothetical protein V1512DRAFT_262940 [Lipomyces arxii]|uniref:mitochondrial 54S ribosomal protein mL53 n=1 Tax=Lipomyces arxii TaxID=56418 RepID=UPI0034CFE23B